MKSNFYKTLQAEVNRIDEAKTTKRQEKIIEGFTTDHLAIIQGKKYQVFNSNDYLGLRFHPDVLAAEHAASQKYGAGPGAVRFISGTFDIYKQLEAQLAQFHQRDDAMIFSSAFATNMAVLFCLIKGQAKNSLVTGETLVISDALNHRSIIDGVRVAGLKSEQKAIYEHLNYAHLEQILTENQGKFTRVLVITDGVFSMLGEYADIVKLKAVTDKFDDQYAEGVLLVVDDSHGVAAFGQSGRGAEEVSGAQCDVLIGTLGKGFGADGGYVVANQVVIDYLRESAATYIYSNSISPSVAGAALRSVQIMQSDEGRRLLQKSRDLIAYFKKQILAAGFQLASDSIHPIQPILIGDTAKAKLFTEGLFEQGILVTTISYPVVPQGRDEIRVQISALHTEEHIDSFVSTSKLIGEKIGIIG